MEGIKFIEIFSSTQKIFDFGKSFGAATFFVGMIIFAIYASKCFFGYTLRKIWFAICGFACTGMLAFIITDVLFKMNTALVIIICVMAGLLGGFLAVKFHKLGIVIMSGAQGYIIFSFLSTYFVLNKNVANAIALVGFIAFVFLGFFFAKPIIIISTAITGAFSAAAGFLLIIGQASLSSAYIMGTAFSIAGIIVQFAMNAHKK